MIFTSRGSRHCGRPGFAYTFWLRAFALPQWGFAPAGVETGRAASGEPCWLIHRQMIGRAQTCKARQATDLITKRARAIVPHICTSDKESALLCTANSVQRAGKANTFNLLAGGLATAAFCSLVPPREI